MKASKKLLAVILALVVGAVVSGCGGGSSESRELNLGVATGWDEAAVVANLSKIVMEEDLGYGEVRLQELELGPVIQGVASGDLDAYQDIWLPNHQAQIDEVQNDIVQLGPWYDGTTEFGIAVPDYMTINTIPELNQTGVTQILGIEPGAVISERIPDSVIPTYNLNQEYVQSSTPSMLSEVENLSENQEEFAFVAWRPHWMNARYDFRYLEDPEDGLTDLNDGATISTITNEDLPDDDPVAYAFLDAVTLTEEQVNEIENINPNDYAESARTWLEDNRDVVQPWIDAAREAEGS
ncbi:MAG: glycine betaine ABC transporter substrate-binding protein [Rubrobacter sp.]|jgi:glycine betaine/proline transport system substrate-binding protein|nr:glycine betaine ABC transporter substrate-binding protein [Rubrobacter sp.]